MQISKGHDSVTNRVAGFICKHVFTEHTSCVTGLAVVGRDAGYSTTYLVRQICLSFSYECGGEADVFVFVLRLWCTIISAKTCTLDAILKPSSGNSPPQCLLEGTLRDDPRNAREGEYLRLHGIRSMLNEVRNKN